MECSEVRPLLGLERDLPPEVRQAVREHVSSCSGCAAASRRADETSRLLGRLTEPDVRLSQISGRAIEARLAAARLEPPRRGLLATVATFAVALLLMGVFVLANPRFGSNELRQLLALWPPGQGLGPRLYLATDLDPNGNMLSAQISILDPVMFQPVFSTTAGDDAILSADQRRMYVAGTKQLTAIDAASQRELWRTPLDHRVTYIGGLGPSSLGLAPDGSELYVLSYNNSDSSASPWFQVVDTAAGVLRPDRVPLPSCAGWAPHVLSPASGERVYVVCPAIVLTINTRSQAVEQSTSLLNLWGLVTDAILSRDGRFIYLLTLTRQLTVLDTATGSMQPPVSVPRPGDTDVRSIGALALSADGGTLVVCEMVQSLPATDTGADLFFYDTHTWTLLRQVRVDQPLKSETLAISPNGRKVYSATGPVGDMPFGSYSVVEIDAASGSITAQHEWTGQRILRLWLMPGNP
jgi:DNA-binding beta-propeller fold protein YncE